MAQITNKEMPMALPSAREDNLQKSLYWLQQEHAKTLRDLHEEISKLQKRCSELTFEISMKASSSAEQGEKVLGEKIAYLENILVCKDRTIDELKDHLQLSESKLKIREENVRILEERICMLQDKLKVAETSRHQPKSAFEEKVLSQSATITQLSNEIHRLKSLLTEKSDFNNVMPDGAVNSLADDTPIVTHASLAPLIPVPPKANKGLGNPPRHHKRLAERHSSDGSVSPLQISSASSTASKTRSQVGRKFSLAESDSSVEEIGARIPDPSPFLSVTKAPTLSKRERMVLPPISHVGDENFNEVSHEPSGLEAGSAFENFKYNFKRQQKSKNSEIKVETLAVDQVKDLKNRKPTQDCKGFNSK